TLRWQSRPQPPTMSGYDAFQGVQADDGSAATPKIPDSSLATLTIASCGTGVGVPVGTDVVLPLAVSQPGLGAAHYYLVGHSSTTPGAKTALGRGTNNTVLLTPPAATCP